MRLLQQVNKKKNLIRNKIYVILKGTRMRGPSRKIRSLIKVRRHPSIQNYIQGNPQLSQTFESQIASQLSCITLNGTPLKAIVQEAHREVK